MVGNAELEYLVEEQLYDPTATYQTNQFRGGKPGATGPASPHVFQLISQYRGIYDISQEGYISVTAKYKFKLMCRGTDSNVTITYWVNVVDKHQNSNYRLNSRL